MLPSLSSMPKGTPQREPGLLQQGCPLQKGGPHNSSVVTRSSRALPQQTEKLQNEQAAARVLLRFSYNHALLPHTGQDTLIKSACITPLCETILQYQLKSQCHLKGGREYHLLSRTSLVQKVGLPQDCLPIW